MNKNNSSFLNSLVRRYIIKTAFNKLIEIIMEQQYSKSYIDDLILFLEYLFKSRCVWAYELGSILEEKFKFPKIWKPYVVGFRNSKLFQKSKISNEQNIDRPTWIFTDWPTGRPSWIKILMWHWTSSRSHRIALSLFASLSSLFVALWTLFGHTLGHCSRFLIVDLVDAYCFVVILLVFSAVTTRIVFAIGTSKHHNKDWSTHSVVQPILVLYCRVLYSNEKSGNFGNSNFNSLITMTLLTQFKTATATAGITYPSNNVEYATTALQVDLPRL